MEAGFGGKENGELLALAEGVFDTLIAIDKSIRYQQNIVGRRISVLVLRAISNDLDDIRPLVPQAVAALESIQQGQVIEVGSAS